MIRIATLPHSLVCQERNKGSISNLWVWLVFIPMFLWFCRYLVICHIRKWKWVLTHKVFHQLMSWALQVFWGNKSSCGRYKMPDMRYIILKKVHNSFMSIIFISFHYYLKKITTCWNHFSFSKSNGSLQKLQFKQTKTKLKSVAR